LLVAVGGGLTRLEVGVDNADAEAEAKRASRVTLLFLGRSIGDCSGVNLRYVVVGVSQKYPQAMLRSPPGIPMSVEVGYCARRDLEL